jgi:hypothetical protein
MSISSMLPAIAALLYVTAYFQFLHLLRFRRNWLPTSKLEIARCTLSVGILFTIVSVSPDGFQPLALIVSIAFVTFLFYMIAAPAVAFLPTSPIIEFFAKHADYSSLSLMPSALAAGFFLNNNNLRAMLATAMAVEIIWLVRRRIQDRQRVITPLNADALAVLEQQAGGDVPGFAKKHGIGELERGDSPLNWLGCTKLSAPCSFNLYVNRLGLNTAPCCKEHLIALCLYVDRCLTDLGVTHWMEGGTLLGAVREDGLLAWEDAVDISILLDENTTWDELASSLQRKASGDGYAIEVFAKHQLFSIGFDRRAHWPFGYERNRLRGELRVDMSTYREGLSNGDRVIERFTKKARMPMTEDGKFGVPYELVMPTFQMSVFGESVFAPQDPDAYLQLLYGDYKTIEYTYVDPAAAKRRGQQSTHTLL